MQIVPFSEQYQGSAEWKNAGSHVLKIIKYKDITSFSSIMEVPWDLSERGEFVGEQNVFQFVEVLIDDLSAARTNIYMMSSFCNKW